MSYYNSRTDGAFIVFTGRKYLPEISRIAITLRLADLRVEVYWQGGTYARQMRVATHPHRCIRWVLVYDAQEAALSAQQKRNLVSLRDLKSREQRIVTWEEAADYIIDGGW